MIGNLGTFSLELNKFCQGCSEFDARVDKIDMTSVEKKETHTVISCEHSEKCKQIISHFSGK